MESRLEEATRKAIKKAKADGTYKPPKPYYPNQSIGHSVLYEWRIRRIGFRG